MAKFLANFQVAFPVLSAFTGLKALCFVLVGFQPTNCPPHKPMITTSPHNRATTIWVTMIPPYVPPSFKKVDCLKDAPRNYWIR